MRVKTSEIFDEILKMGRICLSRLPRVEGVFEDVLLIQGVFCFVLSINRNIFSIKISRLNGNNGDE